MQKHKNKIIAAAVIACVSAIVLWAVGILPRLRENKPDPADIAATEAVQSFVSETEQPIENLNADDDSAAEDNAEEKTQLQEKSNDDLQSAGSGNINYSEESGTEINRNTGKDKYQTEPIPENRPVPFEPENAVISDRELTCTLSVRCDTILDNISRLDKEKVELVPKDGVIYAERSVTFYEGESVFNLLLREMKKNKIHMEFENTPVYNSAYIEGIGNIYEFDCGELSGWMYSVNGWFPNYGCSRYRLKAGDRVEWVYTCDLGDDVGGNGSARNGFDGNE